MSTSTSNVRTGGVDGYSHHQFAGVNLERAGETADVLEADVAAATLDAADICPIEPSAVGEVLLGDSQPLPEAPDALTELDGSVGEF